MAKDSSWWPKQIPNKGLLVVSWLTYLEIFEIVSEQ